MVVRGYAVVGGCLFLFLSSIASAEASTVEGVVRDGTGAALAGATVTVHVEQFTTTATTDDRGTFSLVNVPEGTASVDVNASGFLPGHVEVFSGARSVHTVEITLKLSPVRQEVVVSATRTEIRLSEAPGSTIRLGATEIAAAPALAVDDVLRQVPGFSLFRRSGSRSANPTSQGVSLRGLGASGASRALVLEDGIPLLDPFGGWIYWDRVPRASLEDVEVFRGGASGLYGSNAMGGVIQFVTREAERPGVVLETSYGNEQTPSLSLWTGTKLASWDVNAATDLFRSDGYILIPSSLRGSVDRPANSKHGTLEFGIGHRTGPDGRLFFRGNLFTEDRHNGTPLQTNDTRIAAGAVGWDQRLGSSNSIRILAYGQAQDYNQNFSSIASDRMSESLTNQQHVPAQDGGIQAQWTHDLGRSQTLVVGTDFLQVIGASEEQVFSSDTHIANAVSGGRQHAIGMFGQDIVRFQRKWTVIVGARVDFWQNYSGLSWRQNLSTGLQTATSHDDRNETAFSPRLSVLRSLTGNLSVSASVYRAFRAPALNELYRSFRVGSVVTQNNAALRAEQMSGAEAGASVSLFERKLELRGTVYWNDIVNPIANVTLTATPALITRQRQNLGRVRSRGLELDGLLHLSKNVEVSAGYGYIDASVVRFPSNTALEGLILPQVPHHQFTLKARYWNPSKLMLSAQGRFAGEQFDDDQNLLPLDRYFTLDVLAARPLVKRLTAFVAVENLLDQQYSVARTPVPSLGPPTLFRVGLRFGYGEGVH